jgi:hypothetical protein
MSSAASLIGAGDVDGDATDDLLGVWGSGLWVKYSKSGNWEKLSISPPNDIDIGLFRTGVWGAGYSHVEGPFGGYAGEPGSDLYNDLTDQGPRGWNFIYQEQKNLSPRESEEMKINRIPGPGEPGFTYTEQKNLVPREAIKKKGLE